MKKFLSAVLSVIMLLSCIQGVTMSSYANEQYVTIKTDNMERYTSADAFNVKSHKYISRFGNDFTSTKVSDKIFHGGKKSVCQSGRFGSNGTIKILNLFNRELTKDDVGKEFRISFYVYLDKEAGVYKKNPSKLAAEERKNYLYTKDELKNSKGSKVYFTMCGPDEDNYKYRAGSGTPSSGNSFVPWNQWTKVTHTYKVEEAYLPTGSTDKLSDPYINAIRIGQSGVDYSIDNALCDTFYIDDLTVDEIGASVEEVINNPYRLMKYDDLESYDMDEEFLVKRHESFSKFGNQFTTTALSDKYAYSGQKSICQSGRYGNNGTIKALNIFGRELNAEDVGKTFMISFKVYFDKEAGAYKKNPSGVDEDERKSLLYTEEELKNSKGTEVIAYMAGPDGDTFANRTGIGSMGVKMFVPWNEWTEVYFYYTVEEKYLPTGNTSAKSDPYLNAVRIGTEADYSIDNPLPDTFYVDDFKVSEVGAIVNGGFINDSVQAITYFTENCRIPYARPIILEYNKDNKLLGVTMGEITDSEGYCVVSHNINDEESRVYVSVYASAFSPVVSPMVEIIRQPEYMGYITPDMAKARAKEMLALSKAEYKDALSFDERVDKENEYFLTTDDTYTVLNAPSETRGEATGLIAKDGYSSLVKFDISDSQKKSVSNAYVYFYTDSVTTPGKAELYAVSNDWSEDELTYNNCPSKGEKISELQIDYKDIVYFFDITSYINKTVTKDIDELSFYITTPDGDFKFISKEHTHKNYKPTLVFEGVGMKEGEKKVSSFDYSNYIIANKKKDRGTRGEYIPTPTRVVDSLTDYTPVTKELTLNKYGSPVTEEKYEATGYFYTKNIDGRWWFIDPEGYKQIHIGVGVVRPEKGYGETEEQTAAFVAKYGTVDNWAKMVVDDLRPYGFNGCGFVGEYGKMLDAEASGVTPLNQTGYRTILQAYSYGDEMLNVFDPNFERKADKLAKNLVGSYADNPHVVGWSFDNEPYASDGMLMKYLKCNPYDQKNMYNYYTAWEWLKSRHGEDATVDDVTEKDKCDWVEFLYDRYMNVCVTAIRKYDQNHMIFGPKLDKPHQGSFRGMSKWVDVILYDYYGNAWTAEHAMIDRFYRWGGKPMINAEWYCKGADACTEESGLTNFSGVGYQATTQAERGYYYQNFVLNMMESKAFIGWHWFRYVDNPGREDKQFDEGADTNANKGIYTNKYEPWPEILSQMKMVNKNVYSLADYFDK